MTEAERIRAAEAAYRAARIERIPPTPKVRDARTWKPYAEVYLPLAAVNLHGILESLPLDADLYPGFDLEPYFELLGYDYNDAAIEGLLVLSRCAEPPGRVSPPLASVEFAWQAGS